MTKKFEEVFRPLEPGAAEHQPLPKAVKRDADRADRDIGNLQRQKESNETRTPKRGRPRVHEPDGHVLAALSADSPEALDALIRANAQAVGARTRGNKRIGQAAFYAELVQHFTLLHREGVSLPRNKRLSVAACSYGLGEILRRHKKIEEALSDDLLLSNSEARQGVADALDRIFSRVADAVEDAPQ